MSQPSSQAPLCIIAGAGDYPRLMAQGAKRAGRRIIGVGFKGAVQPDFIALCDEYNSQRVGSIDGPIQFAKQHGCKELILVGQIKPACLYTMWPDATARRIIGSLDRRNAHSIFGAICDYIESKGLHVLPSHSYMDDHIPAAGHIAGPAPDEQLARIARIGSNYARDIAELDIGQSILMQGEQLLCVEGFQGTNNCIKNGNYPAPEQPRKTLSKICKSQHDMRFDIPCIGINSIHNCQASGVSSIIIEAGRCILLQKDQVLEQCRANGISLIAIEREESHSHIPTLPRQANDRELASSICKILQERGIGNCAAVCDGVIIAVGDRQGTEKCILRAASYMKNLRIGRIINWIIGLIFGYKNSPPCPIILAYNNELSEREEQLLRKHRIQSIHTSAS